MANEPNLLREYTIQVTKPVDTVLTNVLAEVIKRGLLPAGTTVKQFLEATLLPNALNMVVADLKARKQAESVIVTPEQHDAQVAALQGKKPAPMPMRKVVLK